MKERIITGAVMTALLLPVAFFSGSVVLPIVMALFSAVAMGEMLNCIGLLRRYAVSIPSILAAGGTVICAYFFSDIRQFAILYIAIMFLCMFYLMTVSVFSRGKIPICDVSMALFTLLYLSGSLASIVLLRHSEHGQYTLYLVFIGAWVTDVFAYFTGILFGKHKLIPDVSPKKTIEGSIGGTIICAACFVLYALILSNTQHLSPNYLALLLIGIAVSLISQIGDLIMSLIKRHYGIKDYGKIFPGHGGVLDRFDSVLATAPFLYILCVLVNAYVPLF